MVGKKKDDDDDNVVPMGQQVQDDEERLDEYLNETTSPEKPGS